LQPKVPSNSLSEASSSVWIDDNTTFAPDIQTRIINTAMKVVETIDDTVTEILEELVPVQITDESCCTSESSKEKVQKPSTSGMPAPLKRHSTYCKCKNYIKRVTRSFFRKDKN
jgi:hypothetical protein